MHYAKMAAAGYKGGLITAPDIGDFCCAKFTQDDTWYRVLVTGVKESATGNDVTLQQGPLKNKNLARERSLHFCASVSPRAEKYEALSNVSPQGVYIDNICNRNYQCQTSGKLLQTRLKSSCAEKRASCGIN